MRGSVLLRTAQLAYDRREPFRMLTLTEAVHGGPWRLPTSVLADAVQQSARADAMLGASLAVVESQLDRARELLEDAAREPSATSVNLHYTPAVLAMQSAVCYAEAGHADRAVAVYDQALTEDAFSPRDYGFFLSWKATAQALTGQPDVAAETGMASAVRASDASSPRTRRELARVLTVLRPWDYRPAVRQFAATLTT